MPERSKNICLGFIAPDLREPALGTRASDDFSARRFRRFAGRLVASAFACALGGTIFAAPASAALELSVGPDQSIDVAGTSESLRSVIETLCARAGIELRGYGAPDRAFVGRYRGLPAHLLLPRLLREESHAIGLHAGEAGEPVRIAWLRVLGALGSGATIATAQPAARGDVATPDAEAATSPITPAETFEADGVRVLDLLRPALESIGADREAAVRDIARRLADEPHTREPLLGATQTAVAEQIARYYDARQVLAAIGVEIRDEEARRNFGRIVQQVNLALQAQQPQR